VDKDDMVQKKLNAPLRAAAEKGDDDL